MKEVTLEESKQIQLDMLLYVKEICEKHALRYYLAYGTLIGAVRHKGFIPWDDDVDILMPREDYYQFIKYVQEDNPAYFKVVSYDTDPEYTLPLPKMIDTRTLLVQEYAWEEKVDLGVYIDIFILDGVGDTKKEAVERTKDSYRALQDWYRATMKKNVPGTNKLTSFLKWLKVTPYRKKGIRYYMDQIEKCASRKSFDDSKYVAMIHMDGAASKLLNLWKRSSFGEEPCMLEFENHLFSVPKDYDAVLKRTYGDYMQLPPEEQRVSNHTYTAQWKNRK